ncbi:Brp/Blh family beta-carotene 15,15'-dioxygenase [Mongoliitalea daihaiensis]|uniref:Brp/Blh family beta-carotene 15,15'-dioxygenase n=1 Tax=Mongoliitalea daihaiensis TaxID=2782006 RepID=UPI001F177365|nr:Brp/Blh family beta-carotene 15,15'-dioxygenase [Mongoliitalea daihaiensis]UJP64124.1 Brp/Blh family beta-carotene 15,15'-dioxygenase [Mongoliitalea daihaiensis]
MRKIELAAKVIAFFIGLLYLLFFQESDWLMYTLFVGVMLTVGISHGAIDHLLLNPSIRGKALGIFIAKYLGIMTVYLAVWLVFPLLGLIAFILMSAYHFGQSHFLNLAQGKFPQIVYFTTGLFFLLLILWADYSETSAIVGTVVNIEPYKSQLLVMIFLTGIAMLISGWMNFGKAFNRSLIEIVMIALLLSQLPLLLGFAIYFGFWHSLPSILVEYEALKDTLGEHKLKNFIYQLMPFTSISIIGIGILLLLMLNRVESESLIFVFFVLISLVSAPHIWYMDKFLMARNQN